MAIRAEGAKGSVSVALTPGLGPGPFAYDNMGDIAMLQVAVDRLLKLWPDARIHVLSDCPDRLSLSCPHAAPLPAVGCDLLLSEDLLMGRYGSLLPRLARTPLIMLKKELWRYWPSLLVAAIGFRLRLTGREAEIPPLCSFREAMNTVDILVVSGAGGFSDHCRGWNMRTLDMIEEATERGVPVAMLGQGLGPLSDRLVLSRCRRVFPLVSLITLRGSPGGADLLTSLGVPPSRVLTTGDEAIELAYEARPAEPGSCLGVNFRLAGSAETDDCDLLTVTAVLRAFANGHHVSMIPVPISLDSYFADQRAISRVLSATDDLSAVGALLDSPMKVIHQIRRCRLVVTGAYHAAVFALAQGIPVVAVAKSAYFISKLRGLQNQFGVGCETVVLSGADVSAVLRDAIERGWDSAERVRAPLLEAALKQMELTWGSYMRVADLVMP